jgi:hypothetical protein
MPVVAIADSLAALEQLEDGRIAGSPQDGDILTAPKLSNQKVDTFL